MFCSLTGIRLAPGTYVTVDDKKYLTSFHSAWSARHAQPYESSCTLDRKSFLKAQLLGIIESCDSAFDSLYAKVLLGASIREDAMFASILAYELFLFTRIMLSDPMLTQGMAFEHFSDFADLLSSVFQMLVQEDVDSCLLSLNAYSKPSATSTLVNAILGFAA